MNIIVIRCRRHNRGENPKSFHLLQIALDQGQKRAMRYLTEKDGNIVKGAWSYTSRPFDSGLYCFHCLNEGIREMIPVDLEDLRDLGLSDLPLVFQSAESFQAITLVNSMLNRYQDAIRNIREFSARSASFDDNRIINRLNPELQHVLQKKVLPKGGELYSFQAKAIEAALTGHDVIITTPTASGKSLAYILPVLEATLCSSDATALYISPLVALTEDQFEALTIFDESGTDWIRKGERFSIHRVCRTLVIGSRRVTIARYDGSVLTGDREEIRRRRPQYVLTTPDMLHMAMLRGAFDDRHWRYLLAGLRYIVIDEMHIYRGILGASFANLIRRLQRLCRLHGTNSQFLCASATMVDPIGTVERFIGRRPVGVDGSEDGVPQHKRMVVIWSSSVDDGQVYATSTHAKNVLLHLINERVRHIAFARSIGEINDIYRFTSAELREQGIDTPLIKPFMRELRPDEKRAIIRDLKDGRLHSVISTTALSMGIDIGSLSAAVIIGFPGSIAQFWQQAGRAGRAGEGVIIFIADRNPLDQFFVQHPEVLFDLNAEPVYCNPDNPYIVRSHFLTAAREFPLSDEDFHLFGKAALDQIQTLTAEGLMTSDGMGRYELTESAKNLADTPFRSLTFAVPVKDQEQRLIVEVDAARAQRALHRHAHYQHIDRYYRVISCDLDWSRGRGEVVVQELEHPEYTTAAHVEIDISIIDCQIQRDNEHYVVGYGIVKCHTRVDGYYEVPLFSRNEPFKYRPLGRAAPPPLEYQTQAFWLLLSPKVLEAILPDEREAAMYSLAGALRLATSIEELCDLSDVEGVGMLHFQDVLRPMVMVYDTVPGGVGITEAAFRRLDRILLRAVQILEECPYCSKHPESRGCPYCVTARYGDEKTINRLAALEIIRNFQSSS